jgi:hypothetical protein
MHVFLVNFSGRFTLPFLFISALTSIIFAFAHGVCQRHSPFRMTIIIFPVQVDDLHQLGKYIYIYMQGGVNQVSNCIPSLILEVIFQIRL